MHHHPNPAVAEAILGLVVDDHPVLWSADEVKRAMGPTSAADVEDAIAILHADGLVHRSGEFVFATRAAHACRALPS